MWKYVLVMAVVLMLGGGFCPAFADNIFDDITDIAKGRNEDFPTTLYVAKTISLEKVPVVNILNADLRIKLESQYGENFGRQGRVSLGLEF
jgi:hypothetical protein